MAHSTDSVTSGDLGARCLSRRPHPVINRFYVCALTVVPFLFMAVVATDVGFLSEDDMFGLSLYLLAVPLFIHFCYGLTPEQTVLPFIAIRPLTDGEIVMAKLKAMALSSAL